VLGVGGHNKNLGHLNRRRRSDQIMEIRANTCQDQSLFPCFAEGFVICLLLLRDCSYSVLLYLPDAPRRLLKGFGLRRRAHGDPFRLINRCDATLFWCEFGVLDNTMTDIGRRHSPHAHSASHRLL
jgi:hypothetical protein